MARTKETPRKNKTSINGSLPSNSLTHPSPAATIKRKPRSSQDHSKHRSSSPAQKLSPSNSVRGRPHHHRASPLLKHPDLSPNHRPASPSHHRSASPSQKRSSDQKHVANDHATLFGAALAHCAEKASELA
uniref:Uncharacterized protein n=1 Tax=Spongospora subterranea TaxID=70186 RepID=A0A0H5QHF4_9EUKA|eukprot:CRZ01445.1 hypothetical protein [Spongospora subterranea]